MSKLHFSHFMAIDHCEMSHIKKSKYHLDEKIFKNLHYLPASDCGRDLSKNRLSVGYTLKCRPKKMTKQRNKKVP